MESLVETLMTRFPQTVLSVEADTARSEVTIQVAAEGILDLARFLHDTPEASFDHLTDICSVDYPEDRQRFEVVYHLHSLSHRRRLRLKARVSEDDPTIASLTPIWKGADFLEREVYDLMGIPPKAEAGAASSNSFRDWTKRRSKWPRVRSPSLRRKRSEPNRPQPPGVGKSCCSTWGLSIRALMGCSASSSNWTVSGL
jgi:Ni,Fe-hydrogenase III component G